VEITIQYIVRNIYTISVAMKEKDHEGVNEMKRLCLLVLIVIMALSCIGLVGCGNGADTPVSPAPEPAATPEETIIPEEAIPKITVPSGNTFWSNIPIYPGATEVHEGSWAIPPTEGDYSMVEWHYYETGDQVTAVSAFYKDQMVSFGWQEMGWMEMQEINWGMYTKNNEEDAAMVWITTEEEKTMFALMRALK
jgi:hypothetical protein